MLWPPYTDERHSVAHWTGGWKCPKAKVNVVVKRKKSLSLPGIKMAVVQTTAKSLCSVRNSGSLEEQSISLMQVDIIKIKFIYISFFH
jgi:hypothetical protein